MFGKILIVLLMLTSLIPSMALGGSNVRYLPAFNVLLMIAVYALFCLKDRETREHLWAYYKGNKYILIIVVLYVITLWISSYKTGLRDNLAFVSGVSVVLVVMHFLFPLIVQKREDMVFVIKSFFLIGLLNVFLASSFFIAHMFGEGSYGVWSRSALSSKYSFLPNHYFPIIKSIFENPNSSGMLTAIAAPAGLFFLQRAKLRTNKFLYILMLVFFIFTILVSFSRASLISIALALFLFLILSSKALLKSAAVMLLGLILPMSFIILAGVNLNFLNNPFIADYERVDLWNKGIKIVKENLFSGVGVSKTVKTLAGNAATHNAFIEIALGAGIFALMLYSLYLALIICRIRILPKNDQDFSTYVILSSGVFFVLQLFETLTFGGMSIANFYFVLIIVSSFSVTSARTKLH